MPLLSPTESYLPYGRGFVGFGSIVSIPEGNSLVRVGMPVARHPPYRSRRALANAPGSSLGYERQSERVGRDA